MLTQQPRPGKAGLEQLIRASAFGLGYGLAAGFAALIGALWQRGVIDQDLWLALLLIAAGAAVAGFLTCLLLAWWGRRRSRPARLAAAIVALVLLTIGFDTLLLYANYISYYAQWWPPAFTTHWFMTALTTLAGVGFYFVTIGVPMLLPLGIPLVIAAAFVLTNRNHRLVRTEQLMTVGAIACPKPLE